ncbi:MAG TPA: Smr/MutS family protein [Aestuariivirga sp.]|jgi:DNA-nicking Smr family endonuclease|nr:Smr/MutS family protein [Aestuariivirga sp.]
MKKKPFAVHDHGLWDEVARRIRPLGKSALKASTSPVSLPKQSIQFAPQKASAPKLSLSKAPPPITGFDRRTGQKLMRGKVEIESRLDLHGLGLEEARMRLLAFISHRRMEGYRLILVITGKGASPFSSHTLHGRDHFYAPEREGHLRRQLPKWLHEAPFRVHVSGFQQAHPRHGGGGAFYVKLRRTREG